MKKILSIALISTVTILLSTGCSTKEPSAPATSKPKTMKAHIGKTDKSTPKTAIYIDDTKTEKAMKAIKKGAHKAGWRTTEFKSNAIIVEKVVNGKAMSSTVKVYNHHISGSKDDASMDELHKLRAAIVKALQAKKTH